MGPYLTTPKKEKEVQNGENNRVKYGACGMQGWRNTMEDSHIACTTLDNNLQLFGVFDGHGGREVALYVKDKFVEELKKLQSFKNKDYFNALRDIFIQVDELLKTPQGKKDILKYSPNEESNSSIFGRPETDNISLYTGCTACVVLITETEIYCANAGDSRCVMCVDGKALDMSVDHKPDMASEK
jgi:serine/threonine protein phosphatase PrpC